MRKGSQVAWCVTIIGIAIFLAGCGGGNGGGSTAYTVSGRITRAESGQGVEGVTIAFSGGFGTATTGFDGKWSKSGLKGAVTVTPSRDGWAFSPGNGLVSGAATDVNFTGGSSGGVVFDDLRLESVVRGIISRPTGSIPVSDVAALTSLRASDCGIRRLGGIEYLTGLEELYLNKNQIVDISPVAGLTSLRILAFYENEVDDITPVAGLTNLKVLGMRNNKIPSLAPVSGLSKLEELYFEDNEVQDIGPIAGLTTLKRIDLDLNEITDISPVAGLTNLELLTAYGNQIGNINAVAGLVNLELLHLGQNQITTISAVAGLTRLRRLDLWRNSITDIGPISALTALNELYVSNNQIANIGALSGIAGLQKLSLWGNLVENIQPLVALTSLELLWLSNNAIQDIQPLVDNAGLGSDDEVDIRHNPLDLTPGSRTMQNIQALIARGVDLRYGSDGSLQSRMDAPPLTAGFGQNMGARGVD